MVSNSDLKIKEGYTHCVGNLRFICSSNDVIYLNKKQKELLQNNLEKLKTKNQKSCEKFFKTKNFWKNKEQFIKKFDICSLEKIDLVTQIYG